MRFPAVTVAALLTTHPPNKQWLSSADNVESTNRRLKKTNGGSIGGSRQKKLLWENGIEKQQQLDNSQQSVFHDSPDVPGRTRPLRYRQEIGLNLFDLKGRGRRDLAKNDTPIQPVHQECDPLGDDLGILSCGTGQYCVESQDSTEGGICVATISRREVQDPTGGNSTTITPTTPFFDEKFNSFCVTGDASYRNCACTNVDEVESTVDIHCRIWEGCTDVESECASTTNHCFSQEYKLNFTASGGYFERSFCYVDTLPFGQSLCFVGAGVNGTFNECSILLDGAKCQSCMMAERFYNEDSCADGEIGCVPKSFFCYEFDCTNIPGGLAGTDCGDGAADPLFQHLRAVGCTDCNICGSGSIVNNPDAIVSFRDGSYECGDLPLTGFYTEVECLDLQVSLAEVCCAIFEYPPTSVPAANAPTIITSSSQPAQAPSPSSSIRDDGNPSSDPTTAAEGGTTPTTETSSSSSSRQYGRVVSFGSNHFVSGTLVVALALFTVGRA